MRYFAFALSATLGLWMFASPLHAQQPTTENESINMLTEKEQQDGWQLLFDGDDLSAWRGFQREDVPAAWDVTEEGVLHFDPDAGEGGDLITDEQFGDFELMLEWKIAEGGNSGIMYRVSEEGEKTWHTGPEYQVLDNARHADAANGPDRQAGANYALHPTDPEAAKPAGQWNQARIVVRGPHVEHWLNGEKVVEYELWSDDWKQRVASTKFSKHPNYGQHKEGHIALQDHSDPVWFRNIKIRPLD